MRNRVLMLATRHIPLTIGIVMIAAAQQLPPMKRVPPAPPQPIAFSHKLHASNGIECQRCHAMPEPGDFADIAGLDVCMSCHSAVKTGSPAIRKLAELHAQGEEILWAPVYLVPDYVFFSHSTHVRKAKASCGACHGPVAERDVLAKERDISMAACMDCHQASGASIDCAYCHEPR
jgi:hypothetical protein